MGADIAAFVDGVPGATEEPGGCRGVQDGRRGLDLLDLNPAPLLSAPNSETRHASHGLDMNVHAAGITQRALSAVVISIGLAACSEEDGGPCTYEDTPIIGTIVGMEASAPATDCPSLCDDTVDVRVDVSDQSGASLDEGVVLLRGAYRGWVDAQGWELGSELNGTDRTITSGTCSPNEREWAIDFGASSEACSDALRSGDAPALGACPASGCYDPDVLQGAACSFDAACRDDQFVVPRTYSCDGGALVVRLDE